MRRGLISWSKQEMPEAVLRQRVHDLQQSMKSQGLSACLAYTSISQPSAVNWLTHFTPYWSEALLIVWPDGEPVMLASLTKRVHTWINEVSLIGEIIMAPKLGENAQAYLNQKLSPGSRVGVIGLNALPGSVGTTLSNAASQFLLEDATDIFARQRLRSDASDLGLVKKADALAKTAFAKLAHRYDTTNPLVADLELQARLGGAEDVVIRIAPDLCKDGVFVRLERDLKLGASYGVELSLAYKGVWIRLIKNYADEATQNAWREVQAWWTTLVDEFECGRGTLPGEHDLPTGAHCTHVQFEACRSTYPFEALELVSLKSMDPIAWGVLSAQVHIQGPSGSTYWCASSLVD